MAGNFTRLVAEPPRLFLPAVYLLALALPLGIAPAEIALSAGLLLWLAGLAARRGPWTPSPVDLPLLAFALGGLASAAFAPRPLGAAGAAASVWTLAPFLLAREAAADERAVRRLLGLLLAGAGIAAAMGIAEGLLGDAPGMQQAMAWLGVPREGGRVRGLFSNHMTFAGQQAMLLVAFAAIASAPTGPDEARPGAGARLRGPARALLPAAMALALVLTAARAAFAAAVAALAAAAFLSRGRRGASPAALALAALLLAALLGGSTLQARLRALGDPPAGPGRAEIWSAALEMLRERPLLGAGPGGYRREARRFIEPSAYRPAHAHSTPLHVAAETGLAGLAAWSWIWAAYFAAVVPRFRRLRRRGDARSPVLLASLLAASVFLAIGFFEHDLGDSEVAMLASFLAGLPFGRAFAEAEPPTGSGTPS
jgi:O-antigen ligase